MKIFIVEDETDLIEFYSEVIRMCGHEVMDTARNGAEAVEKFAAFAERPDLIIMDHRMPVMSGLDATREILSMAPGIKVIFASADSRIEDEARSLGIVSFKKKPFSLERLMANIEKVESAVLTH